MAVPPLALLAAAGFALLAALSGGLVLLGVPMPAPTQRLASDHGVLMALGFLGTVIALERAVALGRRWAFLAPVLSGLGGLWLIAGLPDRGAAALLGTAAATFIGVYVAFLRIDGALHVRVQAAGAIAWLGATLLLLLGQSTAAVVPWLAAFLVLTIAGERLELSRLVPRSPEAQARLVAAAAIFAAGVVLTVALPDVGRRLGGIGLLAMAAWLARHDIARRTVRLGGVTRFVALSLLAGYAWLAVGGLSWLAFGATASGAGYDAMLHAIFLGFVISMVFGHAPVILPAVLGVPLPFRPRFYLHLGLLHAGLLLRIVGGDALGWEPAWVIGGVLNVIALLLFMASSAFAMLREPRRVAPSSVRVRAVDP